MSDAPKPKSDDRSDRLPHEVDEAAIVNPINIARARHAAASSHKSSVVEQARQVKPPKKTPSPPQPVVSSMTLFGLGSDFLGTNGCMLLAFVGFAFFMGSVVGGLVGGSLLLSVGRANGVALWAVATPTPTPIFTPTALPVATPAPTVTPFPTPTPAMEDVIAGIIPSVVTVINQQSYGLSFNPDEGRVVGSGVIVDERGYIATNHHVVESPGDLRVILADGRNVQAELIITDPTEDLAVIKVNADNLTPIKWGDSATVRPGQSVYAIGSPLGDFPNSVSFGIVSGLNRALEMDEHVIDGLIQTDTAINRGSSGGPLINTRGEMIGINTFIIRESEDRGVAEGIAFALPAEAARNLLQPWIAAHSGEAVPIPAAEEPGSN